MAKLLLPVDGSQNASHAVIHAIEMAKSMPGTQLVLLNVQEQLERWYAHGLNSEAARAHLRQLGEDASAEARRLLDEARCVYECLIMFGKPAEVISRVAKERQCSGIVMGTRGLGDVENLFLGSTSYKVVHLSEVPVTLVR
jgi:nucleotide-binding universal stress UspA family protein